MDGIISPEDYWNADKRILFIAKEGHAYQKGSTAEECQKMIEDAGFWLKEVAHGERKNSVPFSLRLTMLCNALRHNDYETIDKVDLRNLQSAAFINLNKRGGYKNCEWKTLKQYVIRYREYISREISLIDPHYIVCCGSDVKNLLEQHIRPEGSFKTLSIYHPSHRVSDIKHLRKLECAVLEQ